MSTETFGLYIVIVLSVLVYTESVICYQCADSKKFGDCQSNMKDFEMSVLNYLENNRTVGEDRGYLKNCTPEWGNYCVIEHYTERVTDETFSFIRGCSKGQTDISVPDFRKFIADNQTACQYYPRSPDHMLACITWCDFDFCNGPSEFRDLVFSTNASSQPLLHLFFIFAHFLQIMFIKCLH